MILRMGVGCLGFWARLILPFGEIFVRQVDGRSIAASFRDRVDKSVVKVSQ